MALPNFSDSNQPTQKWVSAAGIICLALYLMAISVGAILALRAQLIPAIAPSTAPDSQEPATGDRVGEGSQTEQTVAPPSPGQQEPAVVSVAQAAQVESGSASEPEPVGSPEVAGQAPDAAGDISDEATEGQMPPPDPAGTALLAAVAGSLGGSLHALRSLWWYAGHRQLVASWIPMYFLLPFGSGLLAAVVCLVLGAGFWDSGPPQQHVGQIVAIAALVGLFSDEATQKLRQVANTIFTPKEKGSDHQAPAPPKLAIRETLPQTLAADPAADQGLTIKAAGFTPPVVAWLTDPQGAVSAVAAQPTAGADGSFEISARLAVRGSWTLRLTDGEGHSSEDYRLDVG